MLVTNVDGTYEVPDDDPDICPHGKYVGGCGWDLMCMYCELGEEPYVPTCEDAWRDFCRNYEIIRTMGVVPAGYATILQQDGHRPSVIRNRTEDFRQRLEDAIRESYLPKCLNNLNSYYEEHA